MTRSQKEKKNEEELAYILICNSYDLRLLSSYNFFFCTGFEFIYNLHKNHLSCADFSPAPTELRAAENRHRDKRKVQGIGKLIILY